MLVGCPSVLFLGMLYSVNHLRHRTGSATTLKLPLITANVPTQPWHMHMCLCAQAGTLVDYDGWVLPSLAWFISGSYNSHCYQWGHFCSRISYHQPRANRAHLPKKFSVMLVALYAVQSFFFFFFFSPQTECPLALLFTLSIHLVGFPAYMVNLLWLAHFSELLIPPFCHQSQQSWHSYYIWWEPFLFQAEKS